MVTNLQARKVRARQLATLPLTKEDCPAVIDTCSDEHTQWLSLTLGDLTYQLSLTDAENLAMALSSAAQESGR